MKDSFWNRKNSEKMYLVEKIKDRKIWLPGVLLVLNTLLILTILSVKDAAEQAVVYETFSETAKAGTYKIETVEDYLQFAQTVAKGNDYKKCEIVLTEDLDFQGVEQVPVIGIGEGEIITFSGVFNGNGHTIQGMKITNPDGTAAMFADVAGKILNLTMQDCHFEGNISAGIAAELKSEGAILNCYVDADCIGETSGTIAGLFRGYLFNCVGNGERLLSERRGGYVEQCYLEKKGQYISFTEEGVVLDGETVVQNLNNHLPRTGAFHERKDMLRWSKEDNLTITDEKAVLLEEILVKMKVNKQETILKAYYSHNTDHWSVALPPGYHDARLTVIARNTKGQKEKFQRRPEENTILYTDGEYQYLIDFLPIKDADTIMIDLGDNKTLKDIHQNKKKEFPGVITKIDAQGNMKSEYLKGIYGHGNDSWEADKKSYNLKFAEETDFFGFGADEDYVLLAGYRDDSLMSYISTTTMIHKLGFSHALDFDLINVYVEGDYLGVYFLVEKIELDESRLHISSVYEEMKSELGKKLETYEFHSWKDEGTFAERYYYEVESNPEDLSGGYLLELDISDYDAKASRFVTERGNRITMKRAHYSSKEQVNYIADYWQEFEDALYSETGFNESGNHYSEYIDLESFAKQWLLYELVQENSMSSSVYFYKESEVTGDGLLHACFPWDMEHSYLMYGPIEEMWLSESETSNRYWSRFWQHEDFRKMVRKLWEEEFVDVIEQMVNPEPMTDEASMKNLSWYEMHIQNISDMEKSRWWKMDPYERLGTIRDFLNIRKGVLSELLYEE